MKNVTPEQIYMEYHRQRIHLSKGLYPRQIKNWDKIRQKPEWYSFEKLAKLVNANKGHIYYPLLIKAILYFYRDRRLDPCKFSSQGGIKMYRSFISLMNLTKAKDEMEKLVVDNFRFIISYMKQQNLKSFDEYMSEGMAGIPTIAIHFYSGAISKFCLVALPNILNKIEEFPYSVQIEYFKDLKVDYDSTRSFVLKSRAIRKIVESLEKKM